MKIRRIVGHAMAVIWDQIESWGLRLPRADDSNGARLRVLAPDLRSQLRVIGTLWQDRGEFVFSYDPDYTHGADAAPISAFPELDEEYRSHELWPFFAVRIPPAERSDVKEALAKKGLRHDQTLEVLGTLGRRSISNPYQFELVGQSRIRPASTRPAHAEVP